MRSLTWAQVHARRLARSHLRDPAPCVGLVDVVAAVGGIHAQLLTAAELSISARVAGLTRADVQAELWDRRSLVKTWSLRGTLHLHPATELPLWMAARRTRPHWREAPWLEAFDLTPEEAEAILDAIGEALDGRRLTRAELGDEVAARVGSWAKRKTSVIQFGELASTWDQLLGAACQTGRLCFGPSRGSQVTFVRADQWIGGWSELDPDEALAEICRRYLRAYGPATHRDFGHWFGLKPALALRAIESLTKELEEVDVEGRPAWLLAADAGEGWKPVHGSLRLLPHYDCYTIGCGPPGPQREQLVPELAGNRVFDRGAGPFPVLLVDGVVAGTWRRKARGRLVEIAVEPFGRLTSSQREQLRLEAARIGGFLGAEVELSGSA